MSPGKGPGVACLAVRNQDYCGGGGQRHVYIWSSVYLNRSTICNHNVYSFNRNLCVCVLVAWATIFFVSPVVDCLSKQCVIFILKQN